MTDLDQGNSLVRRDEPEEKKKNLKQFSGVGQAKKRPMNSMIAWISRMFFSGKTWKEILQDVVENQVVPEVKQGIRDALVSVIDMKFDKDYSPGSNVNVKTVNNGNFITQYLDYSKESTKSLQAERDANKKKDEEIAKSGYELPSFPNKVLAEQFLKSMHDEVLLDGQLTVHDIAWKQGKNIPWTWESYGWTKDQILAIKRPSRLSKPIISGNTKYYYVIELPTAKLLNVQEGE